MADNILLEEDEVEYLKEVLIKLSRHDVTSYFSIDIIVNQNLVEVIREDSFDVYRLKLPHTLEGHYFPAEVCNDPFN